MNKTGNVILGFISGAVIGAGIGILFAPLKGEDTREMISDQAKDAKDMVQKQWNRTTSKLNMSARKSLSEFEHSLDETLYNASDKADDVIVALQERLDELQEKNKDYMKKKKKAVKA